MIIIGKNVAKEYLETNNKINKIYICNVFNDKNLISTIQNRRINICYLNKNELDKIDNGNHQGIILDVPEYKYYDFEQIDVKENRLIVMLDHIEDTHNFGAIIRTCESAGVNWIIIPKDRSVDINSTVMKTSAGALNNICISKVSNLVNTISKLKKMGYWIIGTDMENSVDYRSIDYDMPIVLIIGNEAVGISKIVRDNCDIVASIPMKGRINSLNASVAAGILIYKIVEKD